MTKNAMVTADYEGAELHFTEDGWFNATEAAGNFDKRPVDWLALDSSQEYLTTLAEVFKCEKSSLLKTKRGRHQGGTWLHPRLAVAFARWLDVRFAIWCDIQIDAILRKSHPVFDWKRSRHEAAASHKMMCSMVKLTRDEEGKISAAHHYSNEARLVNWALTGEFKSLDRESLSFDDLDVLAKLEEHNALQIGKGIAYPIRKGKLEVLAKALLLRKRCLLEEAA